MVLCCREMKIMQIIKHPKKSTVRIIAVVALLLLGLGYLLNFFIGGQVRIGDITADIMTLCLLPKEVILKKNLIIFTKKIW